MGSRKNRSHHSRCQTEKGGKARLSTRFVLQKLSITVFSMFTRQSEALTSLQMDYKDLQEEHGTIKARLEVVNKGQVRYLLFLVLL